MNQNASAIETQVVIYDQARSHFVGNFPDSLPIEQAYVHIGIFLGWIINNELYSEYFEDEGATQMYRFQRRQISCAVLSELWDGHLGSDLFTPEGNRFTYYYYGGGLYEKDYRIVLQKDLQTVYHVEDTWENFDLMAARITVQYQHWKSLIA